MTLNGPNDYVTYEEKNISDMAWEHITWKHFIWCENISYDVKTYYMI